MAYFKSFKDFMYEFPHSLPSYVCPFQMPSLWQCQDQRPRPKLACTMKLTGTSIPDFAFQGSSYVIIMALLWRNQIL
eukprot:scaffold11068_cov129-Skeletonema_menzelii.AAC.4